MNDLGVSWLKFVRQYGPIAKNDSMYDETIQRSARRNRIRPVTFEHPQYQDVLNCMTGSDCEGSVVLTGTAGDGKTHLCRALWERLGGDTKLWAADEPYLTTHSTSGATLHVIRDLSAWVPQRDADWPQEKLELLTRFSRSLFNPTERDVFLVAANDGQLLETWRRLPDLPEIVRSRAALETLLVEDRQELPDTRVRCFNLSRGSSAAVLDRALDAFLSHDGWDECYAGSSADDEVFGPNCPIRHNYELLKQSLVRQRLRALFELCDYNGLHIPIRQILLLLSNGVLGHPDAADRLMVPGDVPKILRARTRGKASLYNNLFGGNLTETRRESLPIFEYLDRFRIGHETSNRIDNVLIFGEADETFRPYFDELLLADTFYGADEAYRCEQRAYIEAGDEEEERGSGFLDHLVSQRRGLFFKIPLKWEDELHLWELTVFRYAGEYLDHVVRTLQNGNRVPGPLLGRLVKGLNRVFVGMLVAGERELFLATSLSFANAKVSRLLEERISVPPRLGEKVEIVLSSGTPTLNVALAPDIQCPLALHLVRYEFLSRVADGALPSSFSRECYEDILAFKSQILAGIEQRRLAQGEDRDVSGLVFHLFDLDDSGVPSEETVEVVIDA
ncbi:MAG: hypothetical protein WBD40_05020 [Tepidisphaeraceae bacterium]